MTRERGAQPAHADPGSRVGTAAAATPIHAIRVAFSDAVAHLERGIAERDYYAANYWVGRGRLHLVAVDHRLGAAGPAASAGDQEELELLRALRVRFERAASVAPTGDEPSSAARDAWLGVATPDTSPAIASPLRADNIRSDGIEYGDVMDAGMGLLGSWVLEQARRSPDPIRRTVADTLHDLTHDAPYLYGFARGTAAGTREALRDFAMGVPQTGELIAEIVRAVAFDGFVELFHKAEHAVSELVRVVPQLVPWFTERWSDPASYPRGEFRGQATAYGVTMLSLVIISAYAGPLAELAGDYAIVIRAIQAIDLASDITTVLRPLGLLGKSARAAHRAETVADLVTDSTRTAEHVGHEVATATDDGVELGRGIAVRDRAGAPPVDDAKPALSSSQRSLDGHSVDTDIRTISPRSRHVIRQLEERGWLRLDAIHPDELVEVSRWFGKEIAVVQAPYGPLRVVLGEHERVLQRQLMRGEVFVVHTHPVMLSKQSHFRLDLQGAGKRTEAVIDWNGAVTYYSKSGIKNPIGNDGAIEPLLDYQAAFTDAHGNIVGFARVDIVDGPDGTIIKVTE